MKKIFSFGLSLTLVLAMVPTSVAAANEGASSFCERYEKPARSLNTKAKQLSDNMFQSSSSAAKRTDERRIKAEEKLASVRAEIDAKRAERQAELEGSTSNDSQKRAVAAYKEAVAAAVAEHRAAVDTANKNYVAAVKQVIASRQAGVSTAATMYQLKLQAAAIKVRQDCEAKLDDQAIRKSYHDTVKQLSQTYKEERRPEANLTASLQKERELRRSQIEQTNATFKLAMEQAVTALRDVFATER